MRRPLPVLATIVTAAFVSACGGGGTDAPTGPAAQNTLTISFGHIDVVQDCDGIEGNGDFTFTIYTSEKSEARKQVYQASPNLGPGARHTVARTSTYVIPAGDGDTFVMVRFQGTEWDKNILGSTYADARLDGQFAEKRHAYTNGTWSNLGVQNVILGTETASDCLVRLTYTASASES